MKKRWFKIGCLSMIMSCMLAVCGFCYDTEASEALEIDVQISETSEDDTQSPKYSYDELVEYSDMIKERVEYFYDKYVKQNDLAEQNEDYVDLLQSLSDWCVIEKRGCITVGIRDLDEKKENSFRELIMDGDFIRFEEGGYFEFAPLADCYKIELGEDEME